jgi:hypothetical protein
VVTYEVPKASKHAIFIHKQILLHKRILKLPLKLQMRGTLTPKEINETNQQ